MSADKLVGAIVAALVVLALGLGGVFVVFAGSLAMIASEPDAAIPPELEAAYRQVGARTGVHWAALAAWDGAENRFALPIPSVESIFAAKVEERLDEKRRAAEDWCREHPENTTSCPPQSPELTDREIDALWHSAHTTWRRMLTAHIERHAAVLAGVAFEDDPESAYGRFLRAEVAARAAELFEGYSLLDSLAADADEILIEPIAPPDGWTPIDGFAWPVVAPITSRFGLRVSPIDGVQRLHAGIDLGVDIGTPVRASRAGRVSAAEWSDVYGWMVVVDHGGGYRSLYAHNSALAVQPGQQVEQGQVLSSAGSTGWSTGPHLHFEIYYNGTPVDPLLLLTARGRD